MQMVLIFMFMLVWLFYDTVPYQESTTLQLCRTAAAVGNTIYVRSQITDSRQHAESTAPACDALPAYTPLSLAAATAAASAASVKWHADVKCKDRLNITLLLKRSLKFQIGVLMWHHITPREHNAMYKLYPTAAAVGITIYVRSQITESRQHVESTTLQPCCTAAAKYDTIYVRLASPRYAAASWLCRSLS